MNSRMLDVDVEGRGGGRGGARHDLCSLSENLLRDFVSSVNLKAVSSGKDSQGVDLQEKDTQLQCFS